MAGGLLEPFRGSQRLQRLPWWAIVIGMVIWSILSSKIGIFVEIMPLILCVAMIAQFTIGEIGIYPFRGRHRVYNKVAYYAALLVLTTIANTLLNTPAPWWYPTPSPLWLFVPMLGYGAVSVARGWRVEWKQR